MTDKEIFIEKLTEPFSGSYLTAENHTNYSIVSTCKTWLEVENMMKSENLNFLGITKPPYNPYGKHLNFAFVMEDISHDYEIRWHHISDVWLNMITKSLNIEYRFK